MKRIIVIFFSLFVFYIDAMDNQDSKIKKKYDTKKALEILHISYNDLLDAVKKGNEERIQKFLEAGGNPNEEFITIMSKNSLLHFSALFKHEKIMQLLLSYGARVDITNWCGETPLHRAVDTGNKNMIMMLSRTGAKFNISSIWGQIPRELAQFNKNLDDIIKLLESFQIPSLKLLCMRCIVTNKFDVSELPSELQRAIDCIREDE